jgi:hypothetical protein
LREEKRANARCNGQDALHLSKLHLASPGARLGRPAAGPIDFHAAAVVAALRHEVKGPENRAFVEPAITDG